MGLLNVDLPTGPVNPSTTLDRCERDHYERTVIKWKLHHKDAILEGQAAIARSIEVCLNDQGAAIDGPVGELTSADIEALDRRNPGVYRGCLSEALAEEPAPLEEVAEDEG